MLQAIVDKNFVVTTVNNWEHEVGIPCGVDVEVGMVYVGGKFIEHPTDTQRRLTAVIQHHLDSTAQALAYDSILSMCTYATSAVPKFRTEGQAAITWRDQVWATATQIMQEVLEQSRPVPTEEELLAALPKLDLVK